MKIAVLGSNGFIGQRLVHHFKKQSLNVFSYDSKQFNLLDKESWKNLDIDCECIVIAAGKICNDENAFKVNADPIPELINELTKTQIRKIIYLSTGAVYGSYEIPTSPRLACNPETLYGQSKLKAEQCLIKNWTRDLNILRLYFPYGAEQKLPRFIPRLIEKIKLGENIECTKEGGPNITLTHVNDLVKVIFKHFINENNTESVVNLASHYSVSIKELSEILAQNLKMKPEYSYTGNQGNSLSEPYPFEWESSGKFNDLFI